MRTGIEYVERLRDGRNVFIDGEKVTDVTRHPAFRGSVGSIAALYDFANLPENRDAITYTSPKTGGPVNRSFMIPRSEDDLAVRRGALKLLTQRSFGLMGRGPEHVAGFLAGFAGCSDVFAKAGQHFADNMVNFYEKIRDEDLYVAYTIVPPQIDRSKPAHLQADPFLYAGVKSETDAGIIVSGAQMLGTGAAIADYIFLSCITPLGAGDENYAISAAIPLSAPGVKVISRRSYARGATSVFDYPLSSQFDETDSLVVYEDVFIPWDSVFVYRDLDVLRAQWTETPAHLLGNNQAQIRLWTKLDFLVGLCHRVADMNGSAKAPAVKGVLGEMAAWAATFQALVLAQEKHCAIDAFGVAWPGQAECFAGMTLQSRVYPELLTMARDLAGGGLIQLPSSAEDYANPEIAAMLRTYVQSPGYESEARVKLLKLMWDLVGSEFASRHQQYEMFYAGAPFIVKMRMLDSYDMEVASALVDDALSRYDLGGLRTVGGTA
jgi:4-hydroxyphenylacetate 3-monooxygenase